MRAVRILEDKGYMMEVSRMAVRWIPGASAPAFLQSMTTPTGMVPLNKRQDFFGIWDLIYCRPAERGFIQVTVPSQVSARREKILGSRFPVTFLDWILVYHGRPRAKFRILRGPDFSYDAPQEWIEAPRRPRKPRERRSTA